MTSASLGTLDFSPEPDLHPLYPTPAHLAPLFSPNSGLSPLQKQELGSHCLTRSCVFGDFSLLSYLLSDPHAQHYIDLSARDEDGLGLVSLIIQGFGSESDKDVEREECVRLLISQGADITGVDNAGWTPLHHAALYSPPTLISHLMTHGCSPLAVTRRKLTALDIITAHTILPGRNDVALLLEESMRTEGWTGGRVEEKRRALDERLRRKGKRKAVQDRVTQILSLPPRWWDAENFDNDDDSSGSDIEDEVSEQVYTPSADFANMLAWSPQELPNILDSLINKLRPALRSTQVANTLYLMARFACLTCDPDWVENLLISAADAIEERYYNDSEDITALVYWLYNTTILLHLIKCDNSISEACEMIGSSELLEELINPIFVFIIRFAERRIDQFMNPALLDHTPLSSEFDSVRFESEWSFLRPFSSKKKAHSNSSTPNTTPMRNGTPSSPPFTASRPPSPSSSLAASPPSKGFASLRSSIARARTSTGGSIQTMFNDTAQSPVQELTSFLTALHTFLVLSDINPALVGQFWSQVIYWTSCELFNRILSRKKYVCRSRAVQINMNLSVLEEWIDDVGLHKGIASHFAPLRELLSWLQCLSSITDFLNLVATIQTMKNINPLQMRRAVRDYKYEVNEGRMTEECFQYLTQLQKDWERHRVKIGVEALRKEMGDREREREEYEDSVSHDEAPNSSSRPESSIEIDVAQRNIDLMFDKSAEKSDWEPSRPPQALGELLDSRFMLPLLLPSDPRMLAASSRKTAIIDHGRSTHPQPFNDARSVSTVSTTDKGLMLWSLHSRRVRDIEASLLRWVDGTRTSARPLPLPTSADLDVEDDSKDPSLSDNSELGSHDDVVVKVTPLTRKPSARRGRPSTGGEAETPVPLSPLEPIEQSIA
ncbi:hypothetical protein CONPUDRAFT_161452 [Coniophora puteana RWD-64-598 SS2]|uniref:Dilute domain-containing protein n=1 Tax=Coniophora puteana (strain RWD-64-598) TaxID=741705 RepID=A0A5M3N6B5_CONPW|nr:uncharacterized protein CONPUDRAFT_161452 [Coniophora puteana RWD-64-598 SS2]EIW86798.1 hypothetical protein CONPUDRAFT_161452 [Coniophora puteana RWD-64-598 SS2]